MTSLMSESAENLRHRAEEKAYLDENTPTQSLSPEETEHLLYELRVNQIELEMQNEELLCSQLELDAVRSRYFELYDLAPVGYLAVDENRVIRSANLAVVTLLGVGRRDLLGKQITLFICREDQDIFYQYCKQALKTTDPQVCEMRLQRADGTIFWVRLRITSGKSGEYWITLDDVSELNRWKETAKRSNSELEARVPERTATHDRSNEEMKEVAFKLLWAEERERERMACVLREQVGQSLLMAKMKLEALAVHTSPDSFRKHVDEAAVLIETSIRDVLSLTSKIRPTILETFRIETALEWLCSSIGNEYSLLIDFTDDLRPKPLAEEVSYALYQAVRELLLNVVKHADAEKAQLSLKTDNQQLVVQVNDNGVGFNTHDIHRKHSNKRGYGLYSVKQRMGFVGGSFAVESAPGKGTSVTLTVPLGEMKGVCE